MRGFFTSRVAPANPDGSQTGVSGCQADISKTRQSVWNLVRFWTGPPYADGHDTPHHPRAGPRPDPTDRPLVVQAAYAETHARIWEWQAEFGLTLSEPAGCVQRAGWS